MFHGCALTRFLSVNYILFIGDVVWERICIMVERDPNRHIVGSVVPPPNFCQEIQSGLGFT